MTRIAGSVGRKSRELHLFSLSAHASARACFCLMRTVLLHLTPEQGTEIVLAKPWRRVTMHELVEEKLGCSVDSFESLDELKEAARALKGMEGMGGIIDGAMSKGEIVAKVFEETCEQDLIQPTFVTDYPKEVRTTLEH